MTVGTAYHHSIIITVLNSARAGALAKHTSINEVSSMTVGTSRIQDAALKKKHRSAPSRQLARCEIQDAALKTLIVDQRRP